MLQRVLSGRFASPQDVAQDVAYLVDPASAYITGHVLNVMNVDGGVLANR